MDRRSPQPTASLTVAEVLDRWPGAARVFLRQGMACVGCDMARFDTVAEAAQAYDLPPAALIAALRRATRPADQKSASPTRLTPRAGEGESPFVPSTARHDRSHPALLREPGSDLEPDLEPGLDPRSGSAPEADSKADPQADDPNTDPGADR
jgi:hybrid cluster-associated redox disulfide protein